MEVLRLGYRIPFLSRPPLSTEPIPLPSYNPSSTKGVVPEEVTLGLITKGAVELAPLPSPGFYSRLFVVWKTSGSWRPVIDLSTLNRFVDVSHFQMETIQSVLPSIHQGDWMASIDLREAYLQVPVHPESRPFLRFVSNGHVYQFKALCFGLSTAPQVFTRVMAPVSAIIHSMSIRMHRYLDVWLVQSSSRESLLRDLRVVLSLCLELGIVLKPREIQPRSISGCPISRGDHRCPVFCGFSVARSDIQASLNFRRISILRLASRQCLAVSAGDAFLDGLPGPRGQAVHAVSPTMPPPVLGSLGSDASDVGWGAHLGPLVVFSLWDVEEAHLPINARELLAVRRGLLHFQSSLCGKTVAVFCDNATAVAYLRKAGGTRSPLLSSIAQGILRWLESLAIHLAPQFIPGSNNVLADALSRPHQLPHSEWSLNMTVFRSLSRQWPVQIDLFATSANHRCSTYFSPYRDPQSAGTDAFLQSWDGLQAYACPPFAIIPRVLAKLRESRGTELTLVAPHGLSALGFRTSSSCRWSLQWSSPTVPTSCSSLGLGSATRVSTGCGFMPGDSPEIHQSSGFLVGRS